MLRAELARPGYRCEPINLGANTDPYQPIEREYRITRQVIEVLAACHRPLTIVAKNALVERRDHPGLPGCALRCMITSILMPMKDPDAHYRDH